MSIGLEKKVKNSKKAQFLTSSENWSTRSSSAVKFVRIVYERASLSSLSLERVLASVVSISLYSSDLYKEFSPPLSP